MKRLYFVRHGESEANVTRTFVGSTESPLTAKGIEQAEAAGEQAKKLQIDYIITSPLSRTYDTAVIVARNIAYPLENIERNELLVERGFGSIVGASWDEDIDIDAAEGVETMNQLFERAQLAYEYLQSLPYDSILVSSHGTFGWALRGIIHPELRAIPENESAGLPNAKIIQLI